MKIITTQLQVVHALAIRDIQSQQANLAYGLGWVFFDAVTAFAGLLIMKMVIRGFGGVPGAPPILYLVTGLIPWLMFSSIYHLPDAAIKRGKNLLLLPMVTELDLVLAASLRIFMTYSILFIVLSTVASFYENVGFPKFPLGVLLLFFSTALIGVVFGLVLMILTRLYPPAGKFVGFFMRFAMIISGVIFPITIFPATVWAYLTWNPLLHIEELLRTYWFPAYRSPIGSSLYVAECLIGMTFLGLLLERYARRRLPP